jgi:cytoskeletal protein CcmA (bactofilin family)
MPSPAAAEVTQSDLVLVREEEVVAEDLIAAGNRVQVDGRIEGDLVAAAFEEVIINGTVTGDVSAISTRVTINGVVEGSLRAASRELQVNGSVGDDVFAAAWTLTFDAAGATGRDLIAYVRTGTIAGAVGRDVRGRFSDLTLAAMVDGSVELTVGSLSIGPTTRVAGEIAYRSDREAVVQAAEPGVIIHRTPLPPNIRIRALQLLTFSLLWLFVLAGGLISTRYWAERLARAAAAVSKPVGTWLAGFGAAVSPLLVLGLLGLLLSVTPASAGLPLAIVFLPFAIGLAGLVLMGALAGVVPVAAAVGQRLRREASLPGSFALGMVVMGVLFLVPLLKWVVLAGAVPLGLGSWLAGRP